MSNDAAKGGAGGGESRSSMCRADDFVKLISRDNDEYMVSRECALISGTIKSMITGAGNFQESQTGTVTFNEISSPILEKVIQYFYYKMKYSPSTTTETPEFPIDPEIALELLMAANFLDT